MHVAILSLLLLSACPAQALKGTVTRLADGDTLWVRLDDQSGADRVRPGSTLKVRVHGLDAPERCQPWGPEAKAALASRVLNRSVRLRARATDDYHRSIATIELEGEDIGAWMVANGHAWSTRFRRSAGAYAAQERAARAARRGLFAHPGAIDPRVFRKIHGPCP